MAAGRTYFDNGYQPSVTSSFDRAVIQATPIYAITDQATGKMFGASFSGYQAFGGNMYVGRFSTTYVTGSHALKAGIEASRGKGPNGVRGWYTGDLTMTFTNGNPQSVTLRIPIDTEDGYGDQQLFVQDRWTLKRATITGGVRYDHIVGYVNDSTLRPADGIRRGSSRGSRWSTGRTCLRVSESPTTCSATARRRSRPASPVTWRRKATARRS